MFKEDPACHTWSSDSADEETESLSDLIILYLLGHMLESPVELWKILTTPQTKTVSLWVEPRNKYFFLNSDMYDSII